MADQSISQLGVATALTGDELTVVVQNGITKQTQLQDIADLGGPAGPVGPQGPTGPTGPGATIQVNSTVTGAPGTNASVTNVGSLQDALFNFVIPRGDVGATGATGATGPAGPGVAAGGTAGQVLIKASSVDYATAWLTLTGTGTVTSVDASGGTTGLTFSGGPITAAGVLTLAGTLGVANGGTGTTTLTGYIKGSGTSPFTAAATIPTSDLFGTISNGQLANSAITINGNSVSLGGSTTVTSNTTNALTIGTGLTGTSFNGSAAVTIAIDSTVATLTGSQTLTNKTISGATNTLSNIGNASLTNSSVTVGTTAIALGASSLTLGGLTSVAVTQDPTTALQLATKQYVDTLAGQGITFHAPVRVESPIALTVTYNNGAAGVGATLTNAGTQAALVIDGVTLSVNDRVLIYTQADATQNGVYTVTNVGSVSTNWVMTRSTDTDTAGTQDPNALGFGDYFFVQQGATGAGESYICNTTGTIVFGTTPISFVQFSAAQVYSAGTGLTLTGTQFSITNTAVTAAAYGSATQVGTFTVNAQGQLTLAGNTSIAIANTQVSGLGTMSTQNASSVAITGGTLNNVVIGGTTPNAGTFTTLNVNTSGYFAGDVGFGTPSTPTAAIDVYRATIGVIALDGGNGTGQGSYIRFRKGGVDVGYVGADGAVNGTASNDFTVAAQSSLTLYANLAERFRAGPQGQWGIAGANYGTSGQVFTSGGPSAAASWTTLGTMSTQNASSVAITGGTINGTTIGATTAAAITGTTITATNYVGISGGTF